MAAMLAAAVVTAGVTFLAMLVVMVITVNIGIVAQISAEQCAQRCVSVPADTAVELAGCILSHRGLARDLRRFLGSAQHSDHHVGRPAPRQKCGKKRSRGRFAYRITSFALQGKPSCSCCRKRAFCKKIISQPLVPWITLIHFRLRSRKTHQTHLMI